MLGDGKCAENFCYARITLMPISALNDEEQRIIALCLRAAVDGPFFPDGEFHSLFGMTRVEVLSVADRFPDVDEFDDEPGSNEDTWLAINNCLLNLLGYPRGNERVWEQWIPVSPDALDQLFMKW